MSEQKDSLDILNDFSQALSCHEPKHYERMPDILDYLTYIDERIDPTTGVKSYERRRLRPIEKELYRVMKRAAGKTACFKETSTLAWELNISTGAVSNAKKILQQSFEQLDGKPLIIVDERMTSTFKEGREVNKKPQHVITMTWIWNYNNAFMDTKNKHKEFFQQYLETYKTGDLTDKEAELALESMKQKIVDNSMAFSNSERPTRARSKCETAHQGARSHSEYNHTPNNHTPYEYSYPTASAVSDDPNRSMINEFMNELGIFGSVQKGIFASYTIKFILTQIKEFKRLASLGKIRHTPGRYFIMMLENPQN